MSYIVKVKEYKVTDGDSLQSIAGKAGISWKELAQFNWGTSDPNKVNIMLRRKVGCTQKAKDGINYIFTSKDDPGIILFPEKENKTAFNTSKSHTIVVKSQKKFVCIHTPNKAPKLGECSYYEWRFEDFLNRHQDCKHEPPVYYFGPLDNEDDSVTYIDKAGAAVEEWWSKKINTTVLKPPYKVYKKGIPIVRESYGYKYCIVFSYTLVPKLSATGKAWMTKARYNLQKFIEQGLLTGRFVSDHDKSWNSTMMNSKSGNIEMKNTDFQAFAFRTHPDAYIRAGLRGISLEDKIRVILTPDFKEWAGSATWYQAYLVAKDYVLNINDTAEYRWVKKTYYETKAQISDAVKQQYQAGLDNVNELLKKWENFF